MTLIKDVFGAAVARTAESRAGSRRNVTGRVALVVMAMLLAWVAPVAAQNQTILVCGVPVQAHLAAGATDHYQLATTTAASGFGSAAVDVIDTSGTIGLMRLHLVSPVNQNDDCTGDTYLDAVVPIEVSDCLGSDAGDYTIEFTSIQEGPDNCGQPLSCGTAPHDARFDVPGEVDPYTFPGAAGQQVSLTAAMPGAGEHAIRLRLFDPSGALVLDNLDNSFDTCLGSDTATLASNGTYTLLVSACITPITGPYSIVWETQPSCPAAVPSGQMAYVAYLPLSETGIGVGVVDAATNQTVAFVPLDPRGRLMSDGYITSRVRITPNNAFAFVLFDGASTIHIINTATNRPVGTVSVPLGDRQPDGDGQLDVAFNPDGTQAYVASNVAGGVLVINTAKRRVEAVISLPAGDLRRAQIAVSPDGQRLYVATGFGDPSDPFAPTASLASRIFVVDAATRSVVGTVDDARFLGTPANLTVRPDGGALFATYASGSFFVVDLATRTVSGSVSCPSDGFGFALDAVVSPDGRTAYVPIGVGICVVDTTVPAISATIPLDPYIFYSGSYGVALAPDGSRLYVTNQYAEQGQDRGPAVEVIDTNTRQVFATVKTVGSSPFGVAVTTPPTGLCVGDDQGQTRVTVGELVTSVNYNADGCPTARTRGLTAR
jgi:YVTN family beta-propeller protein